jgi:hypothetical protein
MKKMHWLWPAQNGFLASGLLLASAFGGFAQTSATVPVVTIQATVPTANWAGGAGVFSVLRSGNPAPALNVYYSIGGTASNGVDYQTISQWVQLAAGVLSNAIVIQPIYHGQTNAETVTLGLCSSPLMSPMATPVNYIIGSPSNATVTIVPANSAPTAALVCPANGATFYTPANIALLALAGEVGGAVTNVEFFAGANDLGRGAPVSVEPNGGGGPAGQEYSLTWLNVPTNLYALTAVATDSTGVSTTSAVVNITVLPGPPPANGPLTVRIVSPPDGSVFQAPVNIPLYAYAVESNGTVTTVEFFAGTNSLGLASPVTAVPPPLPPGEVQPPILIVVPPNNYWELVWSNAPLETNVALTALAADSGGATAVSAPVTISVLPSSAPPTNRPPIVNIIATDPAAIGGTNKWVWPGETNSLPTWAAWPAAVCRLFTNCAPKTAAFTVNRWGDTNGGLTVLYGIGGTASNGVDYVAIPGFVTIPSGNRNAVITIMPIEDGPTNVIKTVILTLEASTNTPADYVVGYPPSAAVIILDSTDPRATAGLLPDRSFHLAMSGPDAAWYSIEYSTNLTSWTPVCTNQVINGSIDFVDPAPLDARARYYRAVPLDGTPSQ